MSKSGLTIFKKANTKWRPDCGRIKKYIPNRRDNFVRIYVFVRLREKLGG